MIFSIKSHQDGAIKAMSILLVMMAICITSILSLGLGDRKSMLLVCSLMILLLLLLLNSKPYFIREYGAKYWKGVQYTGVEQTPANISAPPLKALA
jgi:hypothetical protein